jgi:hypothetical protein
MREADARTNLLAIADVVENHAQTLEGMAITLLRRSKGWQ